MTEFKPLPWQIAPWRDTSPVILLEGSAGGGKSRLAAEKLNGLLKRYDHAMGIMLRKTRESMTNSTVLFFERTVVPDDPFVTHVPSKHRFEYTNGSVLAYGGMADEKQREQIKSIGGGGGIDFAWLEEMTSFHEDDYNQIGSRMRGPAAPFRQVIGTTNPDGPRHWIFKRLIMGKEAKVYRSAANDNRYNPDDYKMSLHRLTGVQAQRLRDGLWVQAEGAVYDNWSDLNVDGDRAVFHPDLPIFWALDDGYKNPRVVLFCQELPDGTIIVIDEYYKSLQLPDQTISDCMERGYGDPALVIYDPSAIQFAAQLWNHPTIPFQTMGANNNVSEGIKATRSYISDGNTQRSLFVHPRCVHLIEEMATYTWSDSIALQGGDPKPVKENDHTCFPAGTMIKTFVGDVPIELIGEGDYVLTRQGYRRVIASSMTGLSDILFTAHLSDGSRLTGTGNHPIWTGNQYTDLRALRYGVTIETSDRYERMYRWQGSLFSAIWLFTKAFSSGAIRSPKTTAIGCTIDRIRVTFERVWKRCTERSGKTLTVLSQTATRSTTAITTPPIMNWIISNSLPPPIIDDITRIFSLTSKKTPPGKSFWKLTNSPKNGTDQKQVGPGTASTDESHGRIANRISAFASNAVRATRPLDQADRDSALTIANQFGGGTSILTMWNANAKSATSHLPPIATVEHAAAPVSVVKLCEEHHDNPIPVYNLTVKGDHEYFANGVLVSNCDALRYMIATEHALRVPRGMGVS